MDIDLSQCSFDAVAVNVVAAWVIQRLKLSTSPPLAWISEQTPRVNLLVSALLAALTAAGMAVSWQDTGVAHTLVISGITPGAVGLFLWTTVKNLAFQHGAYRLMFQPRSVAGPGGKP